MSGLHVFPVQTRVFRAGESLLAFVREEIPRELIHEKMVVAVTSKIVSLAESRLASMRTNDKATLVRREADRFYGEIGYGCFLTIKHGLLIASSGIDESNSESGDYILYPVDPFASAHSLCVSLKKLWGLNEMGIILTDSHTAPLRRGVTGVCLSFAGFQPLKNLIGSRDLFGRELRMTQMNLADGLAAAAVMLMGEGNESRPLAVLRGFELDFTKTEPRATDLSISIEEDLYRPVFEAMESRAERS